MYYKKKPHKSAPKKKEDNNPLLRVRDVVMPYTDIITTGSTGGVMGSHYFRLNSIFDPDKTGIGHQPLYHDQYAPFYNHYRVKKAVVRVSWNPLNNNDALCNYIAGARIQDDILNAGDWIANVENHHGKYRICPRYNQDGLNSITLTYYESFLGDKARTAENIGLMNSTSPTEEAILQIYVQSLDKTTTSATIQFKVDIDYHVELSEPKEVGLS